MTISIFVKMAIVLGGSMFNLKDICRLCLKKEVDLINIFKLNGANESSFASMISALSNITVFDEDGLPPHICDKCRVALELAYKFRLNIIHSHEVLCQTTVKVEEQDNNDIFEDNPDNSVDICNIKIDEDTYRESNTLKNKTLKETNNVTYKIVTRNKKCPLCLTAIDDDMMEHLSSHYISSDLTPLIVNGRKTEKCNLCNKMLVYKTMIPHHRIHLKIHPFKCDVENCNKTFISNQYHRIHMRSHTGLRKYQCQQCGKTFALQGSLKNHEETHIFDSAQCKVCHKMYKNEIMLKRHMKRHKNGPKFKCDEPDCNKVFYVIAELNRHKKVHNDHRPFVCDICSKGFFTNGELVRHGRYHMSIRPHTCMFCSKSFVERTQLRNHEMKHRGERPHVCEYCSMSFIARNKLKRHQTKSCKHIKK